MRQTEPAEFENGVHVSHTPVPTAVIGAHISIGDVLEILDERTSKMQSELDAVLEAMVNRDRQAADEVRTGMRAGEWRGASVTPSIPRPKGARVKFIPSSPVSGPEMRSQTSAD